MQQGRFWQVVRFLVYAAFLLAAAYLLLDNIDLFRRQSAKTEQSMNRLAEVLDRMNQTLGRLEDRLAPPSSASAPAAPSAGSVSAPPAAATNVAPPAGVAFANDNLRDPLAEPGGGVTSRVITFPGNLNNLTMTEATVSVLNALVVDTLAEVNDDEITRFEPKMAESWEVSADGLVYTIHLRKNVMWQPYEDPVTRQKVAAKPVTSRDFLFHWNTIQNPDVPCEAIRTYYEYLDGIEVVDDYTFKVKWKEPYSMAESFTLGLAPLPEHYYRPDPTWDDKRFAEEFTSSARNQWLVGTGPYKLVKWDKNLEAVFELDENYYGRKPSIQRRHFRLIPDNSVSFLEFKSGKLDIYGLQPQQWHEESPEPMFQLITPDIETANADSIAWDKRKKAGEVPADYKYEKFQTRGSSWSWIGYNLRLPLFQDRRVRVALSHLVDKDRILDEVFMGLGTVISGPFIPKSPYYNHNVKPIPFDVEKAKAILAEAGWEDTDGDGILDKDYDGSGKRKPFTFTLMVPAASPLPRKWAAIIEQDMLKAKVKMEIKPIEWSVYVQSLDNHSFDACTLYWSGGVEGDPYQIWHGSGAEREGSSNSIGYNSPEANRLIEEGRRTMDKQKRYEIYQRLHEVIAEDQPYTFLVAPTAVQAQNKRLYNAIVYKGGEMDMGLMWIPRNMRAAE